MAPIDPTVEPPPSVNTGAPKIVIRQFRPEDLTQVHSMFAEGITGYMEKEDSAEDHPELMQFIQQSIESDLSDIDGTYIAPGGNFWVATPVDDPTRVVGMVGLEAKPDKEAELRRLSVSRDFQRFGVGRLLVSTLEQWAADNGYRKVWLTTGSPMTKAHAFYASTGYSETGSFPIFGGIFAIKFEKLVGPAAAAQ